MVACPASPGYGQSALPAPNICAAMSARDLGQCIRALMQKLALQKPHVGPHAPLTWEAPPPMSLHQWCLPPTVPRNLTRSPEAFLTRAACIQAVEASPGWRVAFVAAVLVSGIIKALTLGLRELKMSMENSVYSGEP